MKTKVFFLMAIIMSLIACTKKEAVLPQKQLKSGEIIPGWEKFPQQPTDDYIIDVLEDNDGNILLFSQNIVYHSKSGLKYELPIFSGNGIRQFLKFKELIISSSAGNICYSDDAIRWIVTETPAHHLATDEDFVYSISSMGNLLKSPDAINWDQDFELYNLISHNGTQHIVGVFGVRGIINVQALELSMSRSYISFDGGESWVKENTQLATIYDISLYGNKLIYFGTMQGYLALTLVRTVSNDTWKFPMYYHESGSYTHFAAGLVVYNTPLGTTYIGEMTKPENPPINLQLMPNSIELLKKLRSSTYIILEGDVYYRK